MRNSQRKAQINTYGNKDKSPAWKGRLWAAVWLAWLAFPWGLLGTGRLWDALRSRLPLARAHQMPARPDTVSVSLPAELKARGASRWAGFLHVEGDGSLWEKPSLWTLSSDGHRLHVSSLRAAGKLRCVRITCRLSRCHSVRLSENLSPFQSLPACFLV